MAIYWHIAVFRDPDDLGALAEVIENGRVIEGDWQRDHAGESLNERSQAVLWARAAEALAWLERPGAPVQFEVVRITLPDGYWRAAPRSVEDGHPTEWAYIEPEQQETSSLDELRAAAARETN